MERISILTPTYNRSKFLPLFIHNLKKDGIEFPVEVLLTAISNQPDNKIIHCVWRDITNRRQAQLRLIKAKEKDY